MKKNQKKNKNFKSAFVDQILLGFILMVMMILFIGTVADELKVRNKYETLRKIVQSAALASAKYYVSIENSTNVAQNIALGIVGEQSLGLEVKDDLVFSWDFINEPNSVTVKLENYEEDTFLFRLLDVRSFIFEKIEAKANIIITTLDELPILDNVSDFIPFAINECGKGLDEGIDPGDSFSFVYKTYEIYDSYDSTGFYGLDSIEPDRTDGSQSNFAHFKNEVIEFDRLTTKEYLVDSDQSTIENDAQQLASELEVHKYEPMDISIALLDCNSTRDDINIKNLIPVNLKNIYCGHKQTSESTKDDVFNNETGFENVVWVNWVESKDCSQSGLFRIDVDILYPDIENIVLEY
jgi:hypothetical protein